MENNKLHFDKDDIEQELRAEKAEIADKLYTQLEQKEEENLGLK